MNNLLEKLEIFKDDRFKFDPIKHKYTLDGETFISVTQFISKFHKPFETEKWSKIKAEQRGISQDEIKKEWKDKNDRANFIGTSLHNWIEDFFNNKFNKIPKDLDVVDRINKFNILYAKQLHKLNPLVFEQRIFSEKWKIAGMFDSVFEHEGHLLIVDWKSNGSFTDDNHDKGRYEKLLPPFDNLWKNHLNEYSIQISLYRAILKQYDIKTKGGFLVHIGPDSEAKIYKCLDLVSLLEDYLDKN